MENQVKVDKNSMKCLKYRKKVSEMFENCYTFMEIFVKKKNVKIAQIMLVKSLKIVQKLIKHHQNGVKYF